MAGTVYPANHPIAVMYWERALFREALKQTWFYKFMGKSSDSMIQYLPQTGQGPGEKVRVTLRAQLQGDGIAGDGTLEGNEEALQVATDNVIIDQLRHAVTSGGRMSDQRIPFSVREEAYMGLKDWFSGRLDAWAGNQLGGNTLGGVAGSDIRYTGMQATIAPSANNWLFAGPGDSASEASVTTSASSYFRLTDVDRMVLTAKTKANTPIRPIMVNGEAKYILFIHPNQHTQLRMNSATGQYVDIQKAAMMGGQITKNPLYTGAIAEWNGCIVHESTRVPFSNATTGSAAATALATANRARAILCGAQAGIFAVGQNTSEDATPNWFEKVFDYGNKLGVAGGLIGGLKKTQFTINGTAEDFGTIVLSTFSPVS